MDNISETFKTMEELPRYHGHFYNWYDTQSLHPLNPHYISTADSGNLTGSLIVLSVGFAELVNRPIVPEKWLQSLGDTSQILLDELHTELKKKQQLTDDDNFAHIQKTVSEQIKSLKSECTTLPDINDGLSAFVLVISELEGLVPKDSEVYFWICALRNQCEDIQNDIVYMAPWLEVNYYRLKGGSL